MADYNNRLGDYVDVAARIAEFRGKYPDGSLQPADLMQPYRIETIADRTYIVVVAAAYRTPTDERPGIGMAYEAWPGRTPYTKDSELMNAETSAWGRAIVAVLAADTKRGVASADEVRTRQEERSYDAEQQEHLRARYEAEIASASAEDLPGIAERLLADHRADAMSPALYKHLKAVGGRRKAELAAPPQPEPATVPLPADGTPPTERAMKRMHATFRELGYSQDAKYPLMSRVTGREITSSTQLTGVDVDAIIVELDGQKAKLARKEPADATA